MKPAAIPSGAVQPAAHLKLVSDRAAGDASGITLSGVSKTYRTRESAIASLLAEAGERWPGVVIGSYPAFPLDGPQVEVVLKSSDAASLAEASEWLASAIEERG